MEKQPFGKKVALMVSGLLGFIVPGLFALDIYTHHLVENLATWGMVLTLDVLGLILAVKAGNRRPLLQLGWCLAAICIVAAILSNKGLWHWGWVETTSLICCGIAIALWVRKDAASGLWPFMAACFLSFIPQGVDFWYQPQPGTAWLWTGTIAGCVFAIIGAPKRDFANTFVPWVSILLNGLILALILR